MKKRIKWITYLLIGALLFSDVSIPSYAARDVSGNNPGEEEELPESIGEPQEEEPAAEEEDLYTTGTIMSFCAPKKSSYINEYKLCLERQLEEFPTTLQARISGRDSLTEVPVSWFCKEDYDKRLGTYHFEAEVEDGALLAADIKLPQLTLRVMREKPDVKFNNAMPIGEPLPYSEHVLDANEEILTSEGDAYYNAFEEGLLPDVRNQNPYGTCWAMATIAGIECSLIKQGLASNKVDLSELQQIYYANNLPADPKHLRDDDCIELEPADAKPDIMETGGSVLFALRTMDKQIGTIKEADLPYENAEQVCADGLSDEYVSDKNYAVLESYEYVERDDRQGIKRLIKTDGAALISYYHDFDYYSAIYNSYNTNKARGGGHAITVVGWDDNFPKENFIEKPAHDGAWLVRNSWGENDYGEEGYFWISYDDYGIRNVESCVFGVKASKKLADHVYSYVTSAPTQADDTVRKRSYTAKTIFPVNGGEKLDSVQFFSCAEDVHYEVKVTAGDKEYTKSGNRDLRGSERVWFDPSEVETIPEDMDVTVEVTLTKQHGGADPQLEVGVEGDYGLLSEMSDGDILTLWIKGNHTIGSNKHFYSYTRENGVNSGEQVSEGDNYVMLFTKDSEPAPSGKLQILQDGSEPEGLTGHPGETIALSVSLPDGYTASDVVWSSSNEGYATVDATGLVTFGAAKGSAVIWAKTRDDRYKASCYAKVIPYKIRFHLDGGSWGTPLWPKEYFPGDEVTITSGPYKVGYRLKSFRKGSLEGEVIHSTTVHYTTDTSSMGEGHASFPELHMDGQTGDLDIYVEWEKKDTILKAVLPTDMLGNFENEEAAYGSLVLTPELLTGGYALPTKEDSDNPYIRAVTDEARMPADYEFTGWSLDRAGTKPVTGLTLENYYRTGFSKYNVFEYYQPQILLLYPMYRPIPSLEKTFLVTYVNDGTYIRKNPVNYKAGSQGLEKAITLQKPTKKGYIFRGWYMDKACKGPVYTTIPEKSLGNLTFYAKWDKENYRISYVLNGGAMVAKNPTAYQIDSAVTFQKPVKAGNTFVGWFADAACTKEKPSIQKGSTGNLTLYALWIPNVQLKSAKNKSGKKIKLSWKANKSVNGYLVEYATDKAFKKGKKSKKVQKGATDSLTLSKLKKNKTYYIRIAPYVKKGAKTYYGVWSAAKKVKVKK